MASYQFTTTSLDEAMTYLNGPKYASLLYSIAVSLRSQQKYDTDKGKTGYEIMMEICSEYGIDPFGDN